MNGTKKQQYKNGLIKRLPVGLGYLPVSFTFGFMAVSAGLPVWLAVLISMTNLTSSGQFAGTNLIISGGTYIEITLTTFVINMRYMLMSLSLSQKMEPGTSIFHRLLFSFGITDETFAIASVEPKNISGSYMYGLITFPYLGWSAGTFLGACTSGILPEIAKGAMGIALYAMFIAIIIPPAKKQAPILYVILISITITCLIRYIPVFEFISDGFCTIIATVSASMAAAYFYPVNKKEDK